MIDRLLAAVTAAPAGIQIGHVSEVVGLAIRVNDLGLPVGARCAVTTRAKVQVECEVVAVSDDGGATLLPYGEPAGISSGDDVRGIRRVARVPVGPELRGRVLDGLGRPRDGRPLAVRTWRELTAAVPDPLRRGLVTATLPTGVRSLDAFVTLGRGQRIALLGGAGTGKSSLLGMMARGNLADVNVVALIGERNREVGEFIEHVLGPEGLARSIVVVATADEPALVRVRAAHLASVIAEHEREAGSDVALFLDSITRVANAQREIGQAVGERVVQKGYPVSVYQLLAQLLERAGHGETGSVTAIINVLVEADDDVADPIADIVRSHADGHIRLDRALHEAGHYPPVDVVGSLSRVMDAVVTAAQRADRDEVRSLLALYERHREWIETGEYRGGNAELDLAIAVRPAADAFLRQGLSDRTAFEQTVHALHALAETIRRGRAQKASA